MILVRHTFKAEFPLAATPLPVYISARQSSADLMTLTAEMQSENQRLQIMAQAIQERRSQPEEADKLIKALLPTLDGFDRVMHLARSYPQDETIDNWLKSVESIYYRLLNTLENFGLYQMRVVGSKVDLNLHEVVEYRPSAEHANDTIISERQKGYILRGKLLRDAKVVVAYNERSR